MEYLVLTLIFGVGAILGFVVSHVRNCKAITQNVYEYSLNGDSQVCKVYAHMKDNKAMTQAIALKKFGVKNLNSVISELRRHGVKITTVKTTAKDTASYKL